jgi:lysozyme family protein
MPFIHALTETLKHEGGYSNHPADKGGATNFGITERVARSHGYQGDMKDIPIDTVRNIYRTSYWDKLKLDAVDEVSVELAHRIFDIAVNAGDGRAGRFLQTAINLCMKEGSIGVDGVVGNGTLSTLRKMKSEAPFILATVKALHAKHYIDICVANPTQKVFLRGWLRRCGI